MERGAERDLDALPPSVRKRFYEAFAELAENPFHSRPGCDVRQLKGQPGLFAVRVGRYRGIYTVAGTIVQVARIRHRHVAYR